MDIRDTLFSEFHVGPQEGADCLILIEYNSELLNHVSENWEVFAR